MESRKTTWNFLIGKSFLWKCDQSNICKIFMNTIIYGFNITVNSCLCIRGSVRSIDASYLTIAFWGVVDVLSPYWPHQQKCKWTPGYVRIRYHIDFIHHLLPHDTLRFASLVFFFFLCHFFCLSFEFSTFMMILWKLPDKCFASNLATTNSLPCN